MIVGDMIGRPGETDEEGRERESLITMFSPGTSPLSPWVTVLTEQRTPTTSFSRRCLFRGHRICSCEMSWRDIKRAIEVALDRGLI